MSDRRRARTAARSATTPALPPGLSSRCDPLWSDHAAVVEHYGEYLTDCDLSGMAMGQRLYYRAVERWAIANGYESPTQPRRADWGALRRAGIVG